MAFRRRRDVAPAAQEETPRTLTQELFEWADVIVTSVIAVVVIFTLVFKVVSIVGDSMLNTVYPDDKIIITNVGYHPKRGDIVVISRNLNNSIEGRGVESNSPIIKRVIATAGQTVDIDFDRGVVSVDGVVYDEPYVRTPTNLHYDITFPVRVPDHCIFVLGDNRNDSMDSRSSDIGDNGMIDERYVLGRAVFRLFPLSRMGGLK